VDKWHNNPMMIFSNHLLRTCKLPLLSQNSTSNIDLTGAVTKVTLITKECNRSHKKEQISYLQIGSEIGCGSAIVVGSAIVAAVAHFLLESTSPFSESENSKSQSVVSPSESVVSFIIRVI